MSTTWIQTFTGRCFDFAAPDPEVVCLDDIAHGLANQCRFNGQCLHYYSVAEHSCLVAKRAIEIMLANQWGPDDMAVGKAAALMHDASEAYIGDIVTPLRRALVGATALYTVEAAVVAAVTQRFHLDTRPEILDVVRQADLDLLAIEQRDIMAPAPQPWPGLMEIPSHTTVKIMGMSPPQAKLTFLRTAHHFGIV